MKLSLIVPCFNEEQNILPFYNAVVKAFSLVDYEYELVFVNDGSSDQTMAELRKLYEKREREIQIVSFSRNFGKEAAILAGLKAAKGDCVSLIDADLQQRPEVVVAMMDVLLTDGSCDCVVAYQEGRKESPVRKLFKNGFYWVINSIAEVPFRKDASDFRTFRRSVADAILQMGEYCRFSKGLFSWVGFNVQYIPYKVEDRFSGQTKWSFKKLIAYSVDGITSFSTFPCAPFLCWVVFSLYFLFCA